MGFNSDQNSKVTSASADEPALILEFLPDSAYMFTSSLPSCDQAVLAYLVAFVPRVQPARTVSCEALVARSVRKPRQNVASPAASGPKVGPDDVGPSPTTLHQHADTFSSLWISPFADVSSATGRTPSPSTTHDPTLGCYCFSCYSSIWRRWNSSPNRGVIDRVLDLFDRYFDDSGHKLLSIQSEGKKGQVKKQSLLEDFSSMIEPGCGIELQLPKRELSGKFEAGNGGFETVEEETSMGARRTITEMKNGIEEVVEKGTQSSFQNCRTITETKNGIPAVVEKGARSSSLLCDGSPTKTALPEFAVDKNFAINELQCNYAKQRRGKRKCKQVVPLECGGSEAVTQVKDVAASEEESSNASVRPIALRLEDLHLRGQGFLGRVFPGALGGVAIRLWDLISLRMRSHSIY